jgi:hypothetical protein
MCAVSQSHTQWNGTEEQFERLKQAISKYCTCEENKPMCEAHKMLTDQRVLNGLAWIERDATLFKGAEHNK